MQISKNSWHYRLNNNLQGYSFVDRIYARRFTTCTYIRTTIRSMFQLLFTIAVIVTMAVGALSLIINAAWVPLAVWLDLPFLKEMIVPALAVWFISTGMGVIYLLSEVSKRVRTKLSERHEKKLNLLEQRIKDGKEGICSIVEVA